MNKPDNMTAEELSAKFRLLLHFDGLGSATEAEYEELHEILHGNQLSINQLLQEIAPSCQEMLQRCMWKGTQTRCETLFQTIKTTEGYCCSFNYYGLTTNNYPSKLSHSVPKDPRRVTACGYQTGLSVLMQPKIKDYHSTVLGTYGFRVMIHDSFDFADDNAETKIVAANLEAFINISPEATYSTDDIYNLPKQERNCLSADEVSLNYLQKYSYINCLSECRSSIIYELCGCVPYNYPNNGTMPICEMDKLMCIQKNRGKNLAMSRKCAY